MRKLVFLLFVSLYATGMESDEKGEKEEKKKSKIPSLQILCYRELRKAGVSIDRKMLKFFQRRLIECSKKEYEEDNDLSAFARAVTTFELPVDQEAVARMSRELAALQTRPKGDPNRIWNGSVRAHVRTIEAFGSLPSSVRGQVWDEVNQNDRAE